MNVWSRPVRWGLAALAGVVAAAGIWHWHGARNASDGALLIAGGDGGGLPRAEAGAEGFEAAALQAAAALAAEQHSTALLIMRHGHLVFEQYAGRDGADTLVDGGEMADTLLLLAAGIAVGQDGLVMPAAAPFDAARLSAAIGGASGRSYPQYLSRNLWQSLNAAPAQWSGGAVRARAVDWLRVAQLLLHDGRFEGTQVVPPGWVARLSQPREASGAEPFAAADMYYLRGPGATRLWLAPRSDLAVLRVAAAPPGAAIDETRLPNMIVRALRDRPASGGGSLNDLVPGH